jgi:hypothetical protein
LAATNSSSQKPRAKDIVKNAERAAPPPDSRRLKPIFAIAYKFLVIQPGATVLHSTALFALSFSVTIAQMA